MINQLNYLLDTNCVLYPLKGNKNIAQLTKGNILATNFIIEVELLGWKSLTPKDRSVITAYFEATNYYDYNTKIKELAIELIRKYSLKLPDAFVVATALEYNLILISADKVLAKVKELNFHLFNSNL